MLEVEEGMLGTAGLGAAREHALRRCIRLRALVAVRVPDMVVVVVVVVVITVTITATGTAMAPAPVVGLAG